MNNLSRIGRVSRTFRWIFIGWLIWTPLSYAGFWMFFNELPKQFIRYDFPFPIPQPLSFPLRCGALALALLPISVKMIGLWTLIRLFTFYAHGSIFTPQHVKHFRRLGYVLLLWTCVRIVYHAALGLLFSWTAPPGHAVVTVGLGSTDLTALMVGGIILVIAWVMEEGRKLEDEQTLFV